MKIHEFRKYVYDRHDVKCNQKYAKTLPYSFHLSCVEQQGNKFLYLIKDACLEHDVYAKDVVSFALIGHDLIEDARMTYNDIMNLTGGKTYFFSKVLADIIYCVTDEKGKSREERKNDKYYRELSDNELAVFVKLSDIAANTLFSKLTGSNMYDKYKTEFAHFKQMCYKEKYDDFFKYVGNL